MARRKAFTAPPTGTHTGAPTALVPAPSGKHPGKVGGKTSTGGEYTTRHRKSKRQKRAH